MYFLPKNAKELTVTYSDNEIALSVVCPAFKQSINTAFIMDSGNTYHSNISIDVPELCLTHLLTKKKFLLNRHKGGLLAKYLMANVYEYGVICFGDVIRKVPIDLRQAWNYYWGTAFNQENSEYEVYHKDKCIGVKVHAYAGHKDQATCICACCIEICNCECYCSQVKLFNDYLRDYSSRSIRYEQDNKLLNNASLKFNVVSNQLLIIPGSMKNALGLSEYKYPDIFAFVTQEDPTEYRCSVASTEITIQKSWINNGTDSQRLSQLGKADRHCSTRLS